jgi:phosphorylcholine metabolism protein LicD
MEKNQTFILLEELIAICEKYDLEYWILGGFSLDAKRGFISRNHKNIDLCLHEEIFNNSLRIFYNKGFRIIQEGTKFAMYKNNIRIELLILYKQGANFKVSHELFSVIFPKEIFLNFQKMNLLGLYIKIPSNECLKYYGIHSIDEDDKVFAENLSVNDEVFDKIKENILDKNSKKGLDFEEITFD